MRERLVIYTQNLLLKNLLIIATGGILIEHFSITVDLKDVGFDAADNLIRFIPNIKLDCDKTTLAINAID